VALTAASTLRANGLVDPLVIGIPFARGNSGESAHHAALKGE